MADVGGLAIFIVLLRWLATPRRGYELACREPVFYTILTGMLVGLSASNPRGAKKTETTVLAGAFCARIAPRHRALGRDRRQH